MTNAIIGWLRRERSLVVASLAVVVFVLGAEGFYAYDRSLPTHSQLGWTPYDCVFLSLQLFVLNSQNSVSGDHISLGLQFARIAAPLIAFLALLRAASELFVEKVQARAMRRMSGHAIICGLGSYGGALALAHVGAETSGVIVFDPAPDEDWNDILKGANAIVVRRSANATQELLRAGARRAARIYCVTGSDKLNLNIAERAAALATDGGDAAVCYIRASRPSVREAAQVLREQAHGSVLPFDAASSAVGALTLEWPAFWLSDAGELVPYEVVVIGFEVLGKRLVGEMIETWNADAESPRTNGRAFNVTVLDEELSESTNDLSGGGRVYYRPLRFGAANAPRWERAEDRPPLRVFVCLPDPDDALRLRNDLDRWGLDAARDRVILCDLTNPVALRPDAKPQNVPPSLYQEYRLLGRTCTPELLVGGVLEDLATKIHEGWGGSLAWKDLDEHSIERRSSRAAAHYAASLFLSEGLRLHHLGRVQARSPLCLSDEQVEKLARREHARWRRERERAGFVYGAQKGLSAAPPTHPHLQRWDALPETAHAENREGIRNWLRALHEAGFALVPDSTVAHENAR